MDESPILMKKRLRPYLNLTISIQGFDHVFFYLLQMLNIGTVFLVVFKNKSLLAKIICRIVNWPSMPK